MQKRIIAGLLAILFALVPPVKAAEPIISHKVYGPSPWLPYDEFRKWQSAKLSGKPFYIVTAEGRLHHGVSEWRIRWTPKPKNVAWYWYWWFDSTGPEYEAEAAPLVGKKGFDQIWLQSFVDAQGVRKYQAIYLKIIWPKNTIPTAASYESPRAAEPSAPVPPSIPVKVAPAPAPDEPAVSGPKID